MRPPLGRERPIRWALLAALLVAGLLSAPWGGAPPGTSQRWSGRWQVAKDDVYDLYLKCGGRAPARVDGRLVVQRAAVDPRRVRGSLRLQAGLHVLEVECESSARQRGLRLLWAPAGTEPREFDPDALSAVRSVEPRALAAAMAWIGVAVLLVRAGRDAALAPPLARVAPAGAVLLRALPLLLLLYAAALRFEALVARHWLDAAPPWAQRLAAGAAWLRPAAAGWEPKEGGYGGDPKEYLKLASQPRGFYDAHYREPLFVFAVKAGLAVTSGQEVGGSFASAVFSTLSVLLTYLLGARTLSRGIGLVAAACLAIEHDVIRLGVTGNRDDTFICFVLLFAW